MKTLSRSPAPRAPLTRATWIALSLLACGCGLLLSQVGSGGGKGDRLYTRMVKSPPTTVRGAEFRAETEERWDSMALTLYPVDIRLRITNRSDEPLVFPFGDTFGITLHNPDGTEHELDGGRNGTRPVMRPLLLEPGEDYTIVRAARRSRFPSRSFAERSVSRVPAGRRSASAPAAWWLA